MSVKRKVKLPGRFLEEEMCWYIVQFTMDGKLSDPLCGDDIENEDGITGEEKLFHTGDVCQALWRDGNLYEGKVVFESENREAQKKIEKDRLETSHRDAENIFKSTLHDKVGANANIVSPSPSTSANMTPTHPYNIPTPTPSSNMTGAESPAQSYNIPPPPSPTNQSYNIPPPPSPTNQSYNIPPPPSPTNQSYNMLPPPSPSTNRTGSVSSAQSYTKLHPPSPSTNMTGVVSPAQSYTTLCPPSPSTNMTGVVSPAQSYIPPPPSPTNQSYNIPPPPSPTNQSYNIPPPPSPTNMTGAVSPAQSYTTLHPPPPSTNMTTNMTYNLPPPSPSTNMTGAVSPAQSYVTCTSPSPSFFNLNLTGAVPTGQSFNTSSTCNNPVQTTSEDQSVSTALSILSDCGECILKEGQMNSLRAYCGRLEKDVCFWKAEAERVQQELGELKATSGTSSTTNEAGKVSLFDSENHYYPKRGIRIHKCDYIIMPEESQDIPEGYIPLCEGMNILVPSVWLNELQGAFRGKTKTCCFKLLVNGFYQPNEVYKRTACDLVSTPLGRALKGYAMTKLGMDSKTVISALNSKIGTMNRAAKAQETASIPVQPVETISIPVPPVENI